MLVGYGKALAFPRNCWHTKSTGRKRHISHHGRMSWSLGIAYVELRCQDACTLNLETFFFFSLTPPKNCCDRVSQVSEERKEREVKEARRWVGYGCRDACGGAGLASLFGRQRCLPRVLVPSPAWQCFSGRCCKAFSVAQVSTWSQSRAGHAVNFYPLGSAFCKPISPQHSQCSKMEQPDSSKLQRIANFGL